VSPWESRFNPFLIATVAKPVKFSSRNMARPQNRPHRVAVIVTTTNGCYDLPPNPPPDALAEVDSAKYIDAYAEGIRAAGCEPLVREGVPDLGVINWLREARPDICFNVCEGFGGESREAQMPMLLEVLGLPYSGPTPLAAAVTQDKPTTKRLLTSAGLPTPAFEVYECPNAAARCPLPFPLFVKPKHEGSGMGIANGSIVHHREQLHSQVDKILRTYRQPALVERFIDGRELTCGVIGNNGDLRVLPILEVDFHGYPSNLAPVYSSVHKNDLDHLFRYQCPATLPESVIHEIQRLTRATFQITGCRDYARVDFRLAPNGDLYILEINALPGITPRSDMTMMAKAEGRTHPQLVASVLAAALRRYQLS
jgi:D-alanine-D-alanine ligase